MRGHLKCTLLTRTGTDHSVRTLFLTNLGSASGPTQQPGRDQAAGEGGRQAPSSPSYFYCTSRSQFCYMFFFFLNTSNFRVSHMRGMASDVFLLYSYASSAEHKKSMCGTNDIRYHRCQMLLVNFRRETQHLIEHPSASAFPSVRSRSCVLLWSGRWYARYNI